MVHPNRLAIPGPGVRVGLDGIAPLAMGKIEATVSTSGAGLDSDRYTIVLEDNSILSELM